MTFSQTKIQRAINLANDAHQNEWRKGSGLPYMTHIYDVMRLASKIGVSVADYETYCTIILHDVHESGLALDNIGWVVGKDIKENIRLLSYVPEKGITDQLNRTRKQAYLDSFADPLIPLPVLITKALDRLCNVVDFYEAGDCIYAKKYLGKADILFYTIRQRFDAIEQYYGWHVAKGLVNEYNRVNELVAVDPHF